MGYSTYYTLNADHPELHDEMWEYIEENLKEVPYAIPDLSGGNDGDSSWYEHEVNMEQLSAQFPDVLFELHGEGEESNDVWDKTFKGGTLVSERSDGEDLDRYKKLLTLTKELIKSVNNGQVYSKHITAIEAQLLEWKEITL